MNLAYRFCRDRGRAEEMAQEAFLRAFRALAQWRSESAFSTWLFALATNLYCSELRRLPAVLVALESVAEQRDSRTFEEEYEAADRDRLVRRGVAALPPKYREAVLLFYFHDMDIKLAAKSLELPVGTVKARLSPARDILRKKLSPRMLPALLRKEA